MTFPVTLSFTFGGLTTNAQLVNLDADLSNIAAALNGLGNGSSQITQQYIGTANIGNAFISNLSLQQPLSPAFGGTGVASFTDGQLLIGSNTTNGLVASTLSAGNGISITNAPGSVTISGTQQVLSQFHQSVFVASGTFTANTNAIHKFTLVGPGGGGGDVNATTNGGLMIPGGGGGGGATSIYWANITSGTNVTVIVGAGCPHGNIVQRANTAVIIGVTTITAQGGITGDSWQQAANVQVAGGTGGTGVGGTINVLGSSGSVGFLSNLYAIAVTNSGVGGSSLYGAGATGVSGVAVNVTGNDGNAFGAGGSGGVAWSTINGTARGGNGANGLVLIEWSGP